MEAAKDPSPVPLQPARRRLPYKQTRARAKPPIPWVGRLAGSPDVWFFAWASTRAQARRMIEDDLGEVDARSLRRVGGGGYVLFRSTAEATAFEPEPGELLMVYDAPTESWIERTSGADADAAQV